MEAKLKEAARIILREKFDEFTRVYEAFLADGESISGDKELSRLVGDGEESEPDQDVILMMSACSIGSLF